MFFVIVLIAVIIILFVLKDQRWSRKINSWQKSERGNATLVYEGRRLTIFRDGYQNQYWKYCIALEEGDDNPYFSDTYDTEQEAIVAGNEDLRDIGHSSMSRKEKHEVKQDLLHATKGFKSEMQRKLEIARMAVKKREKIISSLLETDFDREKLAQQYRITKSEMRKVHKDRLLAIDSSAKEETELEEIVNQYLDIMDGIEEMQKKSGPI